MTARELYKIGFKLQDAGSDAVLTMGVASANLSFEKRIPITVITGWSSEGGLTDRIRKIACNCLQDTFSESGRIPKGEGPGALMLRDLIQSVEGYMGGTIYVYVEYKIPEVYKTVEASYDDLRLYINGMEITSNRSIPPVTVGKKGE